MRVISARNAHEALPEALYQLRAAGVERSSRNGPVLVFPEPLTTRYSHPCERVIFWPERDANPYFHFFEALWMLSGRNDVEFPTRFNSTFGQYSDDGATYNGAYGYRWRKHFGGDQLKAISHRLREKPDCRRQVLGIWDVATDLGSSSKDVPCNTQAYFQRDLEGRLDMMVTNRSNDLVWGAYGANAVHFSVLLEFMAALVGCEVGRYWQTSMNSHLYLEPHRELLTQLADKAVCPPGRGLPNPYREGSFEPFPMVNIQVGRWERELAAFMENPFGQFDDHFFGSVAQPLMASYEAFRDRQNPGRIGEAKLRLAGCVALDWKRACWEWLDRRERKQ